MNSAYRTLVSVFWILVAFAALNALLIYMDATVLTYLFANFMVFVDTLLGSWLILPPFLSWTLMGFVFGTFFYLSIIEGQRFNSGAVRIGLIAVPVALLVISPIVWARVELRYVRPMTFDDGESRRPGEELRIGSYSFVWVPPGRFRMGSPESEPARNPDETPHVVTLSRGFWLGAHEITQRQWQDTMESNPSRFAGCDNCPVENVSPEQCRLFIEKLAELTEKQYRLPTEAEWEYAARAGTQTAWAAGDDPAALDSHAWYAANSDGKTHPVGEKEPNAWGLYDMHGNVREWCAERYAPYAAARQIDPVGPAEGELFVVRGGGWNLSADACRAARRDTWREGYFEPLDNVGLRLIYMDTPPPAPEPDPDAEGQAESEQPRRKRGRGLVQQVVERNKAVETAYDGEVPVPERTTGSELQTETLPATTP